MLLAAPSLSLSIHLSDIIANAILSSVLVTGLTWGSGLVVLGVLAWALLQTFNHNPPFGFIQIWGQLVFLYLGFTMPWWMVFIGLSLFNTWISLPYAMLLITLAALWFYAVYVAPRRIKVCYINDAAITPAQQKSVSQNTTVAILADLRLGIFSHRSQFENIVRTIHQLEVDAVVILGEWLYAPGADLVGQLMLLKTINKPVYVTHSGQDHQYSPKSTELLLRKDDLQHTFATLGFIEVGQSPKPIATGWHKIVLATPLLTTQQLGLKPLNQPEDVMTTKLPLDGAVILVKNTLQAPATHPFNIILIPASNNPNFTSLSEYSVHIIPSFGQRRIPLRLSPPCITVLQLPDK